MTSSLRDYLAAATSARISAEMFHTAVVVFVIVETGNDAIAGLMITAATLPAVILGPVLGVWLGRTERRRDAMVVNQLLLVTALLGLLLLTGRIPDVFLPLLGLLVGATGPLLSGGFTSILPSIVEAERLPVANGAEAASFNVAAIGGPAAAGAIAAVAGADAAVVAEVCVASLAIVPILRLRIPPPPSVLDEEPPGPWKVMRSGVKFLLTSPGLRETTVATTIAFATIGLLTIGFPRLARELGHDPELAGAMWAALAVGSGMGALFYPRLQRGRGPGLVVGACLLGLGVLVACWPLAKSVPALLVLIGITGLFDGPHLAGVFSIRQRLSPPELLTQVFMTAASLKIAAFALGAASAALVLDAVGVSVAFWIVAAAHVFGGVLLLRARSAIDRPAARAEAQG